MLAVGKGPYVFSRSVSVKLLAGCEAGEEAFQKAVALQKHGFTF